MKITKEQHVVLDGYFKNLGLDRQDRGMLFRYIRTGGNYYCPLMILGENVTGKTTLKNILRYFGVCVYSPHESQSVTLKKRLKLDDGDARYIRDILEKLGIREKC